MERDLSLHGSLGLERSQPGQWGVVVRGRGGPCSMLGALPRPSSRMSPCIQLGCQGRGAAIERLSPAGGELGGRGSQAHTHCRLEPGLCLEPVTLALIYNKEKQHAA